MNLFLSPSFAFKLFALTGTMIILIACQEQAAVENVPVKQDQNPDQGRAEKAPVSKPFAPNSTTPLADLEHLYPVEILKPESSNVYEKYGIEFAGVCYACDLAEIKAGPETIDFINVCDDKDRVQIAGLKYRNAGNRFIAEKNGQVFIFTKVDEAPVYALEIKGKKFSFKNKRIIKYYVPEKIIGKFEQHDCGDFQG